MKDRKKTRAICTYDFQSDPCPFNEKCEYSYCECLSTEVTTNEYDDALGWVAITGLLLSIFIIFGLAYFIIGMFI